MALLGDVERVAVVGAEGDEGRVALGDQRRQRVQVLADASPRGSAPPCPSTSFSRPSGRLRHLVVGPHAGAEIAVEGDSRRAAGCGRRSGGSGRRRAWRGRPGSRASRPGKFMNSARPEHLRVVGEREEVADLEPRAGGFEMRSPARSSTSARAGPSPSPSRRRGNSGGPPTPEHVADLVRVADRGRHAVAQHAAVEFERRDQRRLDVAMGVDEAGNDDLAADVDLAVAANSRRACRRSGRCRSRHRPRSARR